MSGRYIRIVSKSSTKLQYKSQSHYLVIAQHCITAHLIDCEVNRNKSVSWDCALSLSLSLFRCPIRFLSYI